MKKRRSVRERRESDGRGENPKRSVQKYGGPVRSVISVLTFASEKSRRSDDRPKLKLVLRKTDIK